MLAGNVDLKDWYKPNIDKNILNQLSKRSDIRGCLDISLFILAILLTGYLYINKKKITYTSNYPIIAIIRGTLFFVGFIFFYISLTKIPLAEANALFFTNPIIVTFLSVFLLTQIFPKFC